MIIDPKTFYTLTKVGICLGETEVCQFWTGDRESLQQLVTAANGALELRRALESLLARVDERASGGELMGTSALALAAHNARTALKMAGGAA